MTSIEQLQNLVAIRKLKPEPPDLREFNGLLLTAKRMIPDAELVQLSPHSRFQLAYDAAHSLALAALRWHGYRAADQRIDCRHQGPSRGSRKTATHFRVLVIKLCCFLRMSVAHESCIQLIAHGIARP